MLPYFTKELTKRFITDNNLPIPLVDDANMLEYYLNMYRHQYNSKDLYFQMCKEIEENFDGDPNKFLVNYYQVRDDIINDILDGNDIFVVTTFILKSIYIRNETHLHEKSI